MNRYDELNRKVNTSSARRKKRRNNMNLIIVVLIGLLAGLILAGLLIYFCLIRPGKDTGKLPDVSITETDPSAETGPQDTQPSSETEAQSENASAADQQDTLEKAKLMAAMYDYKGAIELIRTVPGHENDAQITGLISEWETLDSQLVKWADNTQITHIFFHTLIYDNQVVFTSDKVNEYNEVMTTISEFKNTIQQMYDRGYVLVRLSDIASVNETTGQMQYNPIYLPEGKKPFVLSEDDVCYYEYMKETGGYANRLVVTPEGRIMNEVDQPDGSVITGSFDVLPILDDFLLEHPDFSYHGAKGILALTGYNGILGYRTSYITYGTEEDLQKHYDELFKAGNYDEAHAVELARDAHLYDVPDIEAERAKAAAVAEAILADGWEFASHSWGHMPMDQVLDQMTGQITSERFYRDTAWFDVEVAPLIGGTNIFIYPKGADIHTWQKYTEENPAYVHLKNMGFDYFCNVDSAQYWVQMDPAACGDGYLRMGRRNLDGFMYFKAMVYPDKNLLSDLVDVYSVFDFERPLPVFGVTLPEGFTGITMPDGQTIPVQAQPAG